MLEIEANVAMTSSREDLSLEFAYLRDTVIEGIRERRVAIVRDGLETYEELLRTFVDTLAALGVPYSKSAAMAEINSWGGGWTEIAWIRDHYRSIANAAIDSETEEIIDPVFYFPVAVAGLAFRAREYYSFHQFIGWYPYLYERALAMKETDARGFAIDRSWRFLSELTRFTIEPPIEEAGSSEELEVLGEFALAVISTLAELLKSAFENSHPEHFQRFARTLNGLFTGYEQRLAYDDPDHLRWQLDQVDMTDADRAALMRRIDRAEAQRSLNARIRQRKELVYLGLEAWMLHKFAEHKLPPDAIAEWRAMIPRPATSNDEWSLFLAAIEHTIELELGWHWWEIRERDDEEGAFTSAGFEPHLQRTLLVRLLEKGVTAETRFTPAREALYLAQENGPLDAGLDQIEADRELWRPVIGERLDGVEPLRTALRDVSARQRALEEQAVIDAPLSAERVEEVQSNLVRTWSESADMRKLVRDLGRFVSGVIAETDEGAIGLNLFDRKDVYVAESNLATGGWGGEYGRSLARGENKLVLDALWSTLARLTEPLGEDLPVLAAIDDALIKLRDTGCAPVIFVVDSWFATNVIMRSESFEAQKTGRSDLSVGNYRNAQVFRLHDGPEPSVLVLDIRRVGIWRQFIPHAVEDQGTYLGNDREILFSVAPVSEGDADAYLAEHPDVLLSEAGPRTREEVVSSLRRSVHLRVIEQFAFDIDDAGAGLRIPLAREF